MWGGRNSSPTGAMSYGFHPELAGGIDVISHLRWVVTGGSHSIKPTVGASGRRRVGRGVEILVLCTCVATLAVLAVMSSDEAHGISSIGCDAA